MRKLHWLWLGLALVALTACSFTGYRGGMKQAASIVDYLYPDTKEAPKLQATVTRLRLPLRVGIAFVPGNGNSTLPEAEKMKLLERARASFAQYSYISGIEIIPTQYLRAKGGFANLDQVARLFNVEVVALVSYDQVRFTDNNALSVLYWTILGAYVIHGDQYDVQTLVDTAVFDVASRKLLFRAPGTSQIKGSATMVGLSERARAAQIDGYQQAVDDMLLALHRELDTFKERVKTDATVKVENKAGYSGGGSDGWFGLGLAAVLLFIGLGKRRGA